MSFFFKRPNPACRFFFYFSYLHDDSAGSLASNRDVEEHLWATHFAHELITENGTF